jgi:hypothetical protein
MRGHDKKLPTKLVLRVSGPNGCPYFIDPKSIMSISPADAWPGWSYLRLSRASDPDKMPLLVFGTPDDIRTAIREIQARTGHCLSDAPHRQSVTPTPGHAGKATQRPSPGSGPTPQAQNPGGTVDGIEAMTAHMQRQACEDLPGNSHGVSRRTAMTPTVAMAANGIAGNHPSFAKRGPQREG